MSRPRYLADNDLNDAIIGGVSRSEPLIDFVRLRDVRLRRSPDPAVLEYAGTNGFIVVSHDVNTMSGYAYQRIAAGQLMAGLFLVEQHAPVRLIIDNLVLIWSASEAEEWHGRVQFLPL